MAVRKHKVAFKDITPTEEKSVISSITLPIEEMGAASKPIPPPKPKVRPKLTLDLSSIRQQSDLFPSSDSVFEDNFNILSEPRQRQSKPLPILKPILISQPRVKPISPEILLSREKPNVHPVSLQSTGKPPGIHMISQPKITPSSSGIETLPLHSDHPGLSRISHEHERQKSFKTSGRRHSNIREPNDIDNVYVQSLKTYQVDNWKHFFERPDKQRSGVVSVAEIRQLLRNPLFIKDMDSHTVEVLQMKCTEPHRQCLTYQELVDIMSNKRTPSFRLAVDGQNKEQLECLTRHERTKCFQVMVRAIARSYLTDDVERQYYADRYTCCPPPIFLPVITLIEVGLFAYHSLDKGNVTHNGPLPVDSVLIYRPDKRIEFWRYICYTFIHAGWVHLMFNMVVQIVVGIPLEMIHGCLRTFIVYMSGVLAGSLGTSVFDMEAYLVGASGGVYALLAAHLANIVLNYSNMELGFLKLAAILIIASADVGFAIWDRYSGTESNTPVGYTAHLMGALAGLTIGLVVLKNFEQKLHDQYIWWIALAVYLGCLVFAICWNVLYY